MYSIVWALEGAGPNPQVCLGLWEGVQGALLWRDLNIAEKNVSILYQTPTKTEHNNLLLFDIILIFLTWRGAGGQPGRGLVLVGGGGGPALLSLRV